MTCALCLENFNEEAFWGMGIIKSPLFEKDVSADKMKKSANLFLLVLN